MLASFKKHLLEFKVPARTSRGAYDKKDVNVLSLTENNKTGIGEASPLPDLSIDDITLMNSTLEALCKFINEKNPLEELVDTLQLKNFPSIQFALESALANLNNGKGPLVFPSAFTKESKGIPINGLVWMSDIEKMWIEAEKKISEGYSCIKIKIGALDFDSECHLLERIRKRYSAFKVELRVDANGAFAADDALSVLKDLKRFELHSIEQPIKPKQYDAMQKLCKEGKIPIALDEELIGLERNEFTKRLLRDINPRYLILKPTLLGGFKACDWWIKTSSDLNIGFWLTSALESNIGLNAIAQYCGKLGLTIPQGLGTGALFKNNFESSLEIKEGKVFFLNKFTK